MHRLVSAPRPRVLATGLLVATGVLLLVRAVAWNAGFLHDDAFITLRYAQNWLAGGGLGWNPGDRVEGYTNFLQLLLAAGLGKLGVDLVVALRVIGISAWLAIVGAIAWASRRAAVGSGAGASYLLPVVATGASVPLVAWTFGGLEAPLTAWLVTVGCLSLDAALSPAESRGRARAALVVAGLAFGLGLMVRLDTGLFPVAGVLALLFSGPASGRWRRLATFALPLAVLVLPWLAWKLVYYGHLLPNTWWVKGTDPSDWRLAAGLRYVGSFALAPPFPLVWLGLAALRAGFARCLRPGDRFVLLALGLHLGWVVYVGGDQMPVWRLLVPVIPVASWLAFRLAVGLGWLDARAGGWRGAIVPALVAVSIALQGVWPGIAGPQRNAAAFVGAAVGEFIADAWRPGALVALNTAGSTPYHAPGLRYLDMLGLNDAHIARRQLTGVRIRGQRLPGHAKGDGAYVLDQQPDYIILGPSSGESATRPWFLSDLEIVEDPRFAAGYVRKRARLEIRDRPGFEDFDQTRSGEVLFTWYERAR